MNSVATEAPSKLTEPERKALQRRTLQVLLVSQVAGSAGISVAVTVGGLSVKAMLNNKDTFAGSASAVVTLGGALAGLLLSNYAQAQGRRKAMVSGYTLALFGALVTIIGAENRMLPIYLFGLLFFGCGQGTNLMARFAAADLTLPNERGRAISLLMFGSTFGAVAAQVLVKWCGKVAVRYGLWEYTGPFVFSAILLVVAIVNTYVRLRPDPLVASGGIRASAPGFHLPPLRTALRVIRRSRSATLALTSMIIAQASMVGVMTMTPIHMATHTATINLHDELKNLSGYVIALHVIGMYGLAPFVGRLSDRNRLRTILGGAGLLIVATLVSALAGYHANLLFLGLFLLGLGWSCCMIGGTALLVDSVSIEQRLSVQGSADLLMSLCGGLAGFSSGFIKRAFGFHTLSQIGMGACLVLLLLTVRHIRKHASQPAIPLAV
jgi:MFS family permease